MLTSLMENYRGERQLQTGSPLALLSLMTGEFDPLKYYTQSKTDSSQVGKKEAPLTMGVGK